MAIIPFEDFSTEERKAFEGVCRRHGRNPAEFTVRGESHGGDGQADEIAQRTISVSDEDVTELFDGHSWIPAFDASFELFQGYRLRPEPGTDVSSPVPSDRDEMTGGSCQYKEMPD